MAETYKRICIKDWEITAKNGDHFEVNRGKEYITSTIDEEWKVLVFSNFWVRVPSDNFAGEIEIFYPEHTMLFWESFLAPWLRSVLYRQLDPQNTQIQNRLCDWLLFYASCFQYLRQNSSDYVRGGI